MWKNWNKHLSLQPLQTSYGHEEIFFLLRYKPLETTKQNKKKTKPPKKNKTKKKNTEIGNKNLANPQNWNSKPLGVEKPRSNSDW